MKSIEIDSQVYMRMLFGLVIGLWLFAMDFSAEAQQTVFTYDAAGNTVAIASTTSTAPAITTTPTTQLLESNQTVSFSVAATGLGNSYQWLSNGVPIVGATSDTLLLPNSVGTNGTYSVVISNGSGSVTSSPVGIWADSNGNGIPDWWELAYFGNCNQPPDGDYDGDGVNNLDEYLEGTDPTNPNSYNPRLYVQAGLGTVTASPDHPYYTLGQMVTLTAIPDPGQTFLGWSGAVTGNKPTIAVLMNSHKYVTANFAVPLATALANTNLYCTTGGNASWYGQTEVSEDGLASAQSGVIGAGQQTSLQAVTPYTTQPFQLSFYWSVSSQAPDNLALTIDGSPYASISGTGAGWQLFQTNLTQGTHILVWTYSKSPNGNAPTGLPYTDSGWVGDVFLTTNSP